MLDFVPYKNGCRVRQKILGDLDFRPNKIGLNSLISQVRWSNLNHLESVLTHYHFVTSKNASKNIHLGYRTRSLIFIHLLPRISIWINFFCRIYLGFLYLLQITSLSSPWEIAHAYLQNPRKILQKKFIHIEILGKRCINMWNNDALIQRIWIQYWAFIS